MIVDLLLQVKDIPVSGPTTHKLLIVRKASPQRELSVPLKQVCKWMPDEDFPTPSL